jgi:hypothetical protein
MDKAIEEQLEGRQPEEVEEINIDNCKADEITGLTDKFTNLTTLSMANCELSSLKGFPSLPNLRKLDLSDNLIAEGLDVLTTCPNLEYIGLSGNPIKDLSTLEPLKKLEHLQNLEVFNCDISDADGYRAKIFEMFAKILYVDGMDRNGQTAPDEFDEDEENDSEEGDSEEEDDVPDEDSEEEDEDNEDGEARGTKRKHDDEENTNDDDA